MKIESIDGNEDRKRVTLDTGDMVEICYTTPFGEVSTITIHARHLMLIATHEETGDSIIIRPGGNTFLEG